MSDPILREVSEEEFDVFRSDMETRNDIEIHDRRSGHVRIYRITRCDDEVFIGEKRPDGVCRIAHGDLDPT